MRIKGKWILDAYNKEISRILLDFISSLLVLEKLLKKDISNLRGISAKNLAICLLENHHYHLEILLADYLKKTNQALESMVKPEVILIEK